MVAVVVALDLVVFYIYTVVHCSMNHPCICDGGCNVYI